MQASETRTSPLWNLEALNILLGILLLASPYLLRYADYDQARVNSALFGPLILGWAITRLTFSPRWRWLSWGNVVMGLWVAVSPFVLGFTDTLTGTLASIVLGLLVALVAATGLIRR